MTAISMFLGLAIVVFLSVVGSVWMKPNLSNCNFATAKTENMRSFYNGLSEEYVRYYVTHESFKARPGTVSLLIVLQKRSETVNIWESTLLKYKGSKLACIFTMRPLNFEAKLNRVVKPNKLEVYHQLLYASPDASKIAVMKRFYLEGIELKGDRHLVLATKDPADKFKATDMEQLVNTMCGHKVDFTPGFFQPLAINTRMKKSCK